MLWAKHCLTC